MALTASFTTYPISGVAVSRDFHVGLQFSRAIDPTTLVGSDFRLRSQLASFHNPSDSQVEFYTDDNITFLVVFHFTGNLGGSQQYLVRLPANRVEYQDDDDNTQTGPDATINTPLFNISVTQELTTTLTYSDSEGAAGTATTATLTANQPVSGVTLDDFSIVDGTLGDTVTEVSSSEYEVDVTPLASGDGTLTLTFAENGTHEGNTETSADLTYTGGGVVEGLTFGSETIANQAWEVGTAESLTLPEATDGTGAITYSLSPTPPAGTTFTAGTRILAGNPTGRFDSTTFTYTATDTESNTVSLTFTIVVTAPALTFASTIANQAWTVGTAVSLTLPTATGGVGTLTYSLSTGLPDSVTFTASTRVLAGTPTGRFTSATFTYTVTDAENVTETQTFTIVVTATAITFNPVSFDNQEWTVGTAVSLTLPEGSGGVGDLTPALTPALPTGVTFTAGTRVLAGTPTAAFSVATFTYTMTDAEGVSASITFTIVVNAVLSIETLDEQALTLDTDYDIEIEITGNPTEVTVEGDWEGWHYDWDADNDMLTISGNAAVAVSDATWSVTAEKGAQTVEEDVTYTVSSPAPVITEPANLTITAGTDYDATPISIAIANNPSVVRLTGLLVGMTYATTSTGVDIMGMLPSNVEVTVTSGTVEIFASNNGGEDTVTPTFTIN